MDVLELTSVGAFIAAVASLWGVYYQRAQIQILERQTAVSERELKQRVQSLGEVVKKFEEERRVRERAISAEREARLTAATLAADKFTSTSFTFAGLSAAWQYQTSLCVAVLASHLESMVAADPVVAGEAKAVKELAASLVTLQVSFSELTASLDDSEQDRQRKLDRTNTAAEILRLSASRFSKVFPSAGPPANLSEVLRHLQDQP